MSEGFFICPQRENRKCVFDLRQSKDGNFLHRFFFFNFHSETSESHQNDCFHAESIEAAAAEGEPAVSAGVAAVSRRGDMKSRNLRVFSCGCWIVGFAPPR